MINFPGFFMSKIISKNLPQSFLFFQYTKRLLHEQRISREVNKPFTGTFKTEYAALRFISVVCGATSFLPP